MLLPVGFAQVGKINATKHKVNHVYKSVCARAPLSALALTEYIWKRRKKNFSPRILNTFENWKLWWWWNAAEFFMLNHNFCAHPVKRTTLTLTHSFTFANSTRLFFFRAEKVALRQSDILLRILCVPHANLKDSLPSPALLEWEWQKYY